ncbi:Threonine/homoserine/homoserine lactone efflux protein [Cupriavidus necator]|uniref:LysE family translocator n=1 Tax=Cupriavidus necator (strain ATCC 17699 / DSM 428 / KCTC 22496 / NCIMB 10442 / H16 / Stanier 337) TaxID=381666 RepID=Q0JZT4_CUPNH|nr:LysE family translocator [Cupriavidus necator]QCC04558.1 LysE family translocator [Cupriavidus necator H16]QQB79251.1 LysE family translocator [Cupriavidus necator]WKA43473.1 LysE family translocator [Cupriavidus necator]CAJ96740.1 putative threonine efflux protein [Cupriavidus necator H16]
MIALTTLSVFAAAVMLLLLSPGPNMAFVMAHGITYGLRGGVATALGIAVADLILTVLTATGITALVMAWAPAFDLIRYAGAAYLLWMAVKALRQPLALKEAVVTQASLRSVFVRAMLNSLLNPKALLFFMVFLPQFVDPGKGGVARQLLVLGLVLTVIATVFHALLGAAGGTVRRFLSRHPKAATLQSRGLAAVLVLLALRVVLTSRPA